MSNLGRRIISGLIAALLVLSGVGLTHYSGQRRAIAWLLAIVTLWAGSEYLELLKKSGARIEPFSFLIFSILVTLAYAIPGGAYGPLVLAGAIVWFLIRYLPQSEPLAALGGGLLGLFYLPYLLHFFYSIYLAPDGLAYSLLFFALVWGYDIGAYLVGKRWGIHKFFPAISPSPQKSWEGIAGGLGLALVMSLVSKLWIAWPDSLGGFLIQAGPLVLATSLSAQLGDFFESKLKRAAGVKDAGRLFPGHGGLLDRIDGLLFTLPVFYGYLHYILHWL